MGQSTPSRFINCTRRMGPTVWDELGPMPMENRSNVDMTAWAANFGAARGGGAWMGATKSLKRRADDCCDVHDRPSALGGTRVRARGRRDGPTVHRTAAGLPALERVRRDSRIAGGMMGSLAHQHGCICTLLPSRPQSLRLDAHRHAALSFAVTPQDVFRRVTSVRDKESTRSLRPTSEQSLNSTRGVLGPSGFKLFVHMYARPSTSSQPALPQAVGSLRRRKLRWP